MSSLLGWVGALLQRVYEIYGVQIDNRRQAAVVLIVKHFVIGVDNTPKLPDHALSISFRILGRGIRAGGAAGARVCPLVPTGDFSGRSGPPGP